MIRDDINAAKIAAMKGGDLRGIDVIADHMRPTSVDFSR